MLIWHGTCSFFSLFFLLFFPYILYLHMYLHYTYFLHDVYTTLTCTTYNTITLVKLNYSWHGTSSCFYKRQHQLNRKHPVQRAVLLFRWWGDFYSNSSWVALTPFHMTYLPLLFTSVPLQLLVHFWQELLFLQPTVPTMVSRTSVGDP